MLNAIGKLYGLGAAVRNALYDRGVFKSHSLGARTISVGNITTGGTGKTPLVAYVANILAESGEKVCILTRGYGRRNPRERVLVSDGTNVLVDARTGGDEPVELARKLIGKAVVVADANRVDAAARAKEKFGITAFVLDDGFQHRRAKRDLDIVCIDATNPWGEKKIHRGMLREPVDGLKRADAFVITRSSLVESTEDITRALRRQNTRASIFESRLRVGATTDLAEFLALTSKAGAGGIANKSSVFAFCALGNPDSFVSQLELDGFTVKGFLSFADHHVYSQNDIDELENKARSKDSESLVTTAKDAVKLSDLKFTLPCYVVEADVSLSDADTFRDLIISS
jgi:tetraacyldisaccharide 4'-kinase